MQPETSYNLISKPGRLADGFDFVVQGDEGEIEFEKVARRRVVHKLRVCLMELRESRCWLRFIFRTELLQENMMGRLVDECTQLCNIVGSSIMTATRNRPKRK